MDNLIRKLITLGVPALIFWIVGGPDRSGNTLVWNSLHRLGSPFNMKAGLLVLVAIGLLANFLSYYLVDELIIRWYLHKRKSASLEQLVSETKTLPITEDLKIKLNWALTENRSFHSVNFSRQIPLLFRGLAISAALGTVGGYFGEVHQFLELMVHFKVQYLLIGLSAGIFFILTRHKKLWLLVSAFCVLINLVEVAHWYWPGAAIATEMNGKPLRVLLSNVLTGNRRYSDVISLVKDENPDLAVFVEVSNAWAEELKVLNDLLPYSFTHQDSPKYGVAIYSKLPLQNPTAQAISSGRKVLFTTVDFQGKTLSVIAGHPSVPTRRKSFIDRNQQLVAMGNYAAQMNNPVMVIGDFNVTMWSPFYQKMVQPARLRNVREGFGILPTWPTHKPLFYIPIDHCLVSQDIQVQNVRVGRQVGSDHLPLITDLILSQTPASNS